MIDDGLVGRADKFSRPLEDAPFELQFALDPAPRSVAGKGAQFATLADADNARRRGDGDAEPRARELEEVPLTGCADVGLSGANGGIARLGCRRLLAEVAARLRAECL